MNYPKAKSFDSSLVEKPGPNPILLTEELFQIMEQGILEQGTEARSKIPSCMPTHMNDGGRTEWSKPPLPLVSHPDCLAPSAGSVVLDLGSGTGITSVMLAREYGFVTYAADLWSDPSENMRFFERMGLCNREIVPVKVDVQGGLPFSHEFFDAVVSIDSYNYFGRDALFLDEKLLPYVKHGGLILFAIPGMKADCHDNVPACLLESWDAEQLDYMYDIPWWRAIFEQSKGAEVVAMEQMECTAQAWAEWLACDNDYARGDKASIEAGALDYLNTIAVILRRK